MTEKVKEWCDMHPVLSKVFLTLFGILCLYNIGYFIGRIIYNIIH